MKPPQVVYRVIFIYSRSNVIPFFQGARERRMENRDDGGGATEIVPPALVQQLLDAPNFFFDALYLHSKPSKENRPQVC
jgi:hypothetical protein